MREISCINKGWKFLKGDDTSAHLSDYDDLSWQQVNLPHAVDISPLISSGGRNYQGICRYRKYFKIDKKDEGEKILLEFEGAMQVLEVWINNHKLSTHYCGYTPAIYDITPYITFTEENVIAVRLDNSDCSDVPPGKNQEVLDFTYEGGIYRNVKIHRLPPVHITNAILENIVAGGGLFITYDFVSEESAEVNIKTHIRNNTDNLKKITVEQSIIDHEDNCVASIKTIIDIKEHEAEHCNQLIKVLDPKLWHPNSPYLYNLQTTLLDNGEIIDSACTSIGIRTFTFTKDKGFIINGNRLKVSGANYHQTFGQVGNAMSDNLLRRDARKLREASMIHIRSHYPFANSFTNECDKLGMMLTISNPGWQYYKEGIFVDRACQNLRDIIHWLRNHPSIIIWEAILNESNNMTKEFQQRVHDIVHEEIPKGPCFTASDSGISDIAYSSFDPGMFDPNLPILPKARMVLGINPDVINAELVKDNHIIMEQAKERLDKPKWIREYGDNPDNFTDHNCAWRVPRAWGEELMIKQVRRMIWDKNKEWVTNYTSCYNNELLCGFGMWPGIEHNRGTHMNPCYGGFLDLQRIPKYSFYFFKSQQDPDVFVDNVDCGPMIFIANSWSELSPDKITVFSNCEHVRLYHNDILIEEREPDTVKIKHPPFTFENDFYYGRDRSEIRVEGLINAEVVATDSRFSPGVTKSLHLGSDLMGIGLEANGSDLLFVRVEAHDDRETLVPLTFDAHEIAFSITGPGKIIGDTIRHTELGITGVLIQSTTEPGKIAVTAQLRYPQKYKRIAIKPGFIEILSE
ncbi:sugar-binding domain-containing protein [Clostridium sp.]